MTDKTFKEKQIRNFVIKLRQKQDEIEMQMFFCSEHNFNLEVEVKRKEADVVRRIIYDMEKEFELGYVSAYSSDDKSTGDEVTFKSELVENDRETDKKETCSCGNNSAIKHSCPYRIEIHDDSASLCKCCSKCEDECRLSI